SCQHPAPQLDELDIVDIEQIDARVLVAQHPIPLFEDVVVAVQIFEVCGPGVEDGPVDECSPFAGWALEEHHVFGGKEHHLHGAQVVSQSSDQLVVDPDLASTSPDLQPNFPLLGPFFEPREDGGRVCLELDEVAVAGNPKALEGSQRVDALEEVVLALCVGTGDDVEARVWLELELFEVPKVPGAERFEPHQSCMGITMNSASARPGSRMTVGDSVSMSSSTTSSPSMTPRTSRR